MKTRFYWEMRKKYKTDRFKGNFSQFHMWNNACTAVMNREYEWSANWFLTVEYVFIISVHIMYYFVEYAEWYGHSDNCVFYTKRKIEMANYY